MSGQNFQNPKFRQNLSKNGFVRRHDIQCYKFSQIFLQISVRTIYIPPCESGFTPPPPVNPSVQNFFLMESEIHENLSKIDSHFIYIRTLCDCCSQNRGKSVGNQPKSLKIKANSQKIIEKPSKFNENRCKINDT